MGRAERREPAGRPVVAVVGLGPAGPELITPEAAVVLERASVVLLRTGRHPAAEPFLDRGAVTFDPLYEAGDSFEATYAAIVEEVVSQAGRHGEVVYAVPGSPLVLEQTVAALRADDRVVVRLVAGMSFLDLAWARLGVDPVAEAVRLVDAQRFAASAAGDRGPLLVAHLWSKQVASDVKLSVEEFPERPVTVLHHLGLADEAVVEIAWEDLDRGFEPDHLTCCYVPELAAPVATELVGLDEVVHVLRERCPWDAEQTHRSLARHLVEEAYEAIEAIDDLGEHPSATGPEAAAHLEEELGDVLCQVLFHSVLAAEEGLFNLADVAREVREKLVRRHPQVFGHGGALPAGAGSPARAQEVSWERLKQEEKGRRSLTDGIPPALPALAFAAKLEGRARAAGLGLAASLADPSRTGRVDDDQDRRRRLAELAVLAGQEGLVGQEGLARLEEGRLGEVLLDLARLAADGRLDPEQALRRAVGRWRERILAAEAAAGGATLGEIEPERRRALWSEAGAG